MKTSELLILILIVLFSIASVGLLVWLITLLPYPWSLIAGIITITSIIIFWRTVLDNAEIENEDEE